MPPRLITGHRRPMASRPFRDLATARQASRSATMTTNKIFTKWDETHSELWAHQPIRLEHEMHKSPAFSIDDLAKLIEGYPREHYSLVQTGARGSKKLWREGCIGKPSCREVIDA